MISPTAAVWLSLAAWTTEARCEAARVNDMDRSSFAGEWKSEAAIFETAYLSSFLGDAAALLQLLTFSLGE